jgi:hypothetical protein
VLEGLADDLTRRLDLGFRRARKALRVPGAPAANARAATASAMRQSNGLFRFGPTWMNHPLKLDDSGSPVAMQVAGRW